MQLEFEDGQDVIIAKSEKFKQFRNKFQGVSLIDYMALMMTSHKLKVICTYLIECLHS
jgi:L-ribulose-5-phosphate 3-epimerase UlaE